MIKNNELVNTIRYDARMRQRANVLAHFDMRQSKTKILFDAIKRQIEYGIDKGFQVVYSNGARRSFKSYIEMSVRSIVQNIALDAM